MTANPATADVLFRAIRIAGKNGSGGREHCMLLNPNLCIRYFLGQMWYTIGPQVENLSLGDICMSMNLIYPCTSYFYYSTYFLKKIHVCNRTEEMYILH